MSISSNYIVEAINYLPDGYSYYRKGVRRRRLSDRFKIRSNNHETDIFFFYNIDTCICNFQ